MKGTPCISVSSLSFPMILVLIRMYLNVSPRIRRDERIAPLRSRAIPIVWAEGGYGGHPMYHGESCIVSHDPCVNYNVFECRSKDPKRREDCTSPFLCNSNSLGRKGYGEYLMYHGESFIVSHVSYANYNVYGYQFKDLKRREDCDPPFSYNLLIYNSM